MIKHIIYIIMGLLYASLGGFIYMNQWFFLKLSPGAAIALGILFVVYGLFRIYRGIQGIRNNEN